MAKKPNTKKPIYDVNWYDDKYQSVVVLRNWSMLITFAAVLGILFMVIASYYFVPLKSVSPFVIQIDESTGVTEVVDSKNENDYTQNEVLIKYFADKYIMARENYNYQTYDENRELVRLMSLPDVYRSYYNDINDPNTGYVNTFATRTDRRISLRSLQVRPPNKTTGEITVDARFYVIEVTTQRRPVEYTIAVQLICHFDTSSALNDTQRMVNPLGFVVTYYNATPETKEK